MADPVVTEYEVINAYAKFFGDEVMVQFPDGLSHDCMVVGSLYDETRRFAARCGESYYAEALRAPTVTCIRCTAYVQERNLPL